MPSAICLVCGCAEDEVEKMHYFPHKLEKSRKWQENMGIKYVGLSLRNYRVCSRHFAPDCYVNHLTFKLSSAAVPTLFPATHHVFLGTEQQPGLGEGSGGLGTSRSSVPTLFPAGHHVLSETEEQPVVSEGSRELDTNRSKCALDEPSTSKQIGVIQPCKSQPQQHIQKRSVFRGIEGLSRSEATPRKLKLMDMVSRKEDHIRKLKQVCRDRRNDIKALSDLSDSNVVQNLFKDMSTSTADFLISQLRCATRHPKGRRWTPAEKVVALALMKRSPRCYNLLRKIVAMPSKRTLLNLLEKVPFDVGINVHLFEHINQSLSKDHENDRLCVLLFDEMDIKEHLYYEVKKDKIIGYEDIAGSSTQKRANRAFVFMCQGLSRNWKQPVAYYFSNNGANANEITSCLNEVLRAAKHIANLDVVATICDMGSSNVKAIRNLQSTQHSFEFEGKKIFTMYDPPHLLKCTVSLFRKHNVLLPVSVGDKEETMEARFSHIRQAHEIDKKTPLIFRAMPKIKDIHMAPIMRFAMKVSIAAQIVSRTVAAFIYAMLTRGEIEQQSIATAAFIHQVDELFDSFNGSQQTAPDGKPLKCAISEDSPHIRFWNGALKYVRSWSFQRRTKTGNLRQGKPPSQWGWLVSIRAIHAVWCYVQQKGLTSLRGRALNQDWLENLFGAVRGGSGSSDNPTPFQFIGSLKTQILNGLTSQHLSGTNCEQDQNVALTNLLSFIQFEDEDINKDVEIQGIIPLKPPSNYNPDKIAHDIADAVSVGSLPVLSVAYVAGFIAKRILKDVHCDICRTMLCSSPEDLHNTFISYKEWTDDQQKLIYPSEMLVIAVGQCITFLENFLPSFGGKPNVLKFAMNTMEETLDFSWLVCPQHKILLKTSILKGVCKIGIPWWCKRQNELQKQIKKDARETKRKLSKFKH